MEIGSAAAVERFRAARAALLNGSAPLQQSLSIAFDRAIDTNDRLATVLFFLGSRCADDFREILLLAANGFGWGATAHLRGMFERSVTVAYIHENPASVADFIDYEYIRRWKVLRAIEQTFGVSPENEAAKLQLKSNFDRVRDRFMVPDCEVCNTKRLNHTWSRLDIVSMTAQLRQRKLTSLVVPGYYLPLGQAHSTFASMALRVREVTADRFQVDAALAEPEADRTLEYAHLLLLNTLIIQHEHFQLVELGGPLNAAFSHFHKAWMPQHPFPE
jgi:hypothetical protein